MLHGNYCLMARTLCASFCCGVLQVFEDGSKICNVFSQKKKCSQFIKSCPPLFCTTTVVALKINK